MRSKDYSNNLLNKVKIDLALNAPADFNNPNMEEFLFTMHHNVEQGIITPRRWHLWYETYVAPKLASSKLQQDVLTRQTAIHNNAMDQVYLTMHLFSVLAELITVFHPAGKALSATSKMLNLLWNYFDGTLTLANSVEQIQQCEFIPAALNTLASQQLIVLTALAQRPEILHIGASTASAFTGFSFAACAFTSFLIECIAIYKCDKRIEALELKKAVSLKNREDMEARALEKSIALEKAIRENYIRNAKSWATCTIVMTVIATIAFLAASGASFGTVPAAILVIALVGVGSGLIRNYWVNKVDHVKNLQFVSKHNLENRLEQLKGKLDPEEIKVIDSLLKRNPRKALKVITYCENNFSQGPQFKIEIGKMLREHSGRFFERGLGKTTSQKMWEALPGHAAPWLKT